MKKWIIFSSLAIICLCALSAVVYFKAMEPKRSAFQKAESAAIKKGLAQAESFYLYNGTETYYVAVGRAKDGKKRVYWIPEKKGKEIIAMDYSSGKSKNDIIRLVNQELKPDKIISVKLGMENDVPLWEVVYQNGSKQMNYEYFDFESGEWLKYYRSI
ncbi:cell wall elongation regulator TseB-like domain-containing protein [Peribacillus deserti]|uniref:Peptidase n=1 Tax=Peribacillus deserti TaxID=673318 RepID=A0A2N5M1Z1_9BACI|nr:DUF5590 domain-containing protein [Peribacillus deserti]PLT28362.1 peptidase [Peribacillus deserti]